MPQVVILLRLLPIGRIKRRQIFNRTFTSNGVVTPSRVFTCNPVLFGGGVPTSPKRLFGAGLTTSPKLMTAGLEPRTRQQDLRSTRGRGRRPSPNWSRPAPNWSRPTPNWGNRQPAASGGGPLGDQFPAKPSQRSRVFKLPKIIAAGFVGPNQRRPSACPTLAALFEQAFVTSEGRSRASTLVAPIAPSAPPSISPGHEYTTTSPCRRSYFGHKDRSHNDLCKIVKTRTIFRPSEHPPSLSKVQARQQLSSPAALDLIAPSKAWPHCILKDFRRV
jgi:hypothetical protein